VVWLGQGLRRADEAAAWLAAAQGGVADDHERLHAEAAVAWAQGRAGEARAKAEAAIAALPKTTDPGAAVAAREALDALVRGAR
jgi:hypothetical protein